MENRIAKFLTSLGAVMIPMLIIQAALWIIESVLLFTAFPEMPLLVKLAACVFLGFGLAFPLLLTSVNASLLPRIKKVGFPEVFGLFTALLSLFFFDVFSWKDRTASDYAKAVFLSLLFGLVEYLYSFLFVAKWREKQSEESFEDKYTGIKAEYHATLRGYRDCRNELNDMREALNESLSQLNEYRAKLTCTHCKQVQTSYATLRRHVKTCSENPKNKAV